MRISLIVAKNIHIFFLAISISRLIFRTVPGRTHLDNRPITGLVLDHVALKWQLEQTLKDIDTA